ncbi:serine carboxypeptidase S28 family protein (macronuclear) [Tetrahymena thermophila SB210]|uniref:Serine carboxypeptidase S28 family protein n=1 Tax=Tetrahymena thermophila (strain SB210) TaxID=312017 RepID=Q22MF3_TETTS|nr:serine carboxypeptidase S28 family protein [Tetrahymena thermophila SB210]EAR86508.2 serine carboxypeptidase S28 family protein [Tetrahymena thermophila SB210]|eukprot:XP_977067.2 serine carboxypeptidase S28 family protein [Tetrahymena thermophila SB210]
MKNLIVLILIFGLACSQQYQTKYFDQLVDHIGFETGDKTFKQKYLIKDDYYRYDKGPILFYCGNEAPVDFSFGGAGFMHTTLAQELNALVVFMEHRYFGESQPFGTEKESFKKGNNKYLTSFQAINDYAKFLVWFKKSLGCGDDECPVVAFGASYGGMLSAWIRMKFPEIIDVSLASSAPIFLYENREGIDETLFYKIVTDTYEQNGCNTQIHRAMNILTDLINSPVPSFLFKIQNKKILNEINEGMKTCKPITDQDNLDVLRSYIDQAYSYMSMFNYPQEGHFVSKMPAWPANYSCTPFEAINDKSTISQLFQAVKKSVDVYYDFEEQKECTNFNTGSTGEINTSAYEILTCADIVQPIHPNGVTDMFYDQPWDKDSYQQYCQETFGLTPNYDYVLNFYGGKNDEEMKQFTRIIFSNGLLDPWQSGSPTKYISDDLPIINMYAAAHCSDLRLPQNGDVESVIQARIQEEKYIKQWIQEKLPTEYFTKKSQI